MTINTVRPSDHAEAKECIDSILLSGVITGAVVVLAVNPINPTHLEFRFYTNGLNILELPAVLRSVAAEMEGRLHAS